MKLALDHIHGKYEESFQNLFNFKAELEEKSPGSIVEIDLKKHANNMCFRRVFVAMKPCIDGFLAGCRPYIGVDSTHLHGRYKGQLASATSIDGHNWLFYVAYAIFDSESTENWEWFLRQLHRAIGSPPGLVISSDACKGLETSVATVFPEAEHRECMRHLYSNFMKKFHGPVFVDNLYSATRAYTEDRFKFHMAKIYGASPESIKYLEIHHPRIWYRCGFSEASKVDYVNNNISESFNKQIKPFKGLNVDELVDSIREMVMTKFSIRRVIGRNLETSILPSVLKDLHAKSRLLGNANISRSDDLVAEVTLLENESNPRRRTVDLNKQECSCRQWQLSGRPCMHAIAFICHMRGCNIESYVHDYYSVAKFRAAYAGVILPMTDKST